MKVLIQDIKFFQSYDDLLVCEKSVKEEHVAGNITTNGPHLNKSACVPSSVFISQSQYTFYLLSFYFLY